MVNANEVIMDGGGGRSDAPTYDVPSSNEVVWASSSSHLDQMEYGDGFGSYSRYGEAAAFSPQPSHVSPLDPNMSSAAQYNPQSPLQSLASVSSPPESPIEPSSGEPYDGQPPSPLSQPHSPVSSSIPTTIHQSAPIWKVPLVAEPQSLDHLGGFSPLPGSSGLQSVFRMASSSSDVASSSYSASHSPPPTDLVSSSTGGLDFAPQRHHLSSSNLLDSTVDSSSEVVERRTSPILDGDELVGSSGAPFSAENSDDDSTSMNGISTSGRGIDDADIPTSDQHLLVLHAVREETAEPLVEPQEPAEAEQGSGSMSNHDPLLNRPNTDSSALTKRLRSRQNNLFISAPSTSLLTSINIPQSTLIQVQQPAQEMLSEDSQIITVSAPEQPMTRSRRTVPTPASTPADITKSFWCEDCPGWYEEECSQHRVVKDIVDKPVLSRAWASLPQAYISIQKLSPGNGNPVYGVISKKEIPKRTRFGPVKGLMTDKSPETRDFLCFSIEQPDGTFVYTDISDENWSNWMRFVRPATTWSEQNVVLVQQGNELFYTSTKRIQVKQELRVGYSMPYAQRRKLRFLEPTGEERREIEESELAWPCFECSDRFCSSLDLQKHLNQHDGNEKRGTFGVRMRGRKKWGLTKTVPLKKLKTDGNSISRVAVIENDPALEVYDRQMDNQEPHQRKQIAKKTQQPRKEMFGCTRCSLKFENKEVVTIHQLCHVVMDSSELTEQVSPAFRTLKCPQCSMLFGLKNDLIQHASTHGKRLNKKLGITTNPMRPNKCLRCYKSFSTSDRLEKHLLSHGNEESKPLGCHLCEKRFLNKSALACHVRIHSDDKEYECPLCKQRFSQIYTLRDHVYEHGKTGSFTCPDCGKLFAEYSQIRKHIRSFHGPKQYPCNNCEKVFHTYDKLKLHQLKHSDHKEFLCANCGKQFKRNDKLKEHMKRMHSAEKEAKAQQARATMKKFIPKVSPTDYHRFIYKCHTCLLGFKRRGMLVNHLAKRHPDISPTSVPELNLPILKTTKDYYCQYCDKVYRSSSKRKAHILKNHPGLELPMSHRKKGGVSESYPNPTFSQTVGTVTTVPHHCSRCHKQYASRAKLLQHHRKIHQSRANFKKEMDRSLEEAGILDEAEEERPAEIVTIKEAVKETQQLEPVPIYPAEYHVAAGGSLAEITDNSIIFDSTLKREVKVETIYLDKTSTTPQMTAIPLTGDVVNQPEYNGDQFIRVAMVAPHQKNVFACDRIKLGDAEFLLPLSVTPSGDLVLNSQGITTEQLLEGSRLRDEDKTTLYR